MKKRRRFIMFLLCFFVVLPITCKIDFPSTQNPGYVIVILMILYWLSLTLQRLIDNKLKRLFISIGTFAILLIVITVARDAFFAGDLFMSRMFGYAYYLPVTCMALLSLITIFTLINEERIKALGAWNRLKLLWIPLLPFAVSIPYFCLYDVLDRYNLCLWSLPQIFVFAILGFWEGCIQIGLVPVNSYYEEYFKNSHVSAEIVNEKGEMVICSKEAKHLSPEERKWELLDDDTLIKRHKIKGGTLYWTEDISSINRLNQQLQEINDFLAEESDLLKAENQLKEEQSKIKEQTLIYEGIANVVNSQRIHIGTLIREAGECPDCFCRNMQIASFFAVYIKRRANLTLMASRESMMAAQEMILSINESLDYLSRIGIPIYHLNPVSAWLPSDVVLEMFDLYEDIIEKSLSSITGLMVRRNVTGEYFELRMTVEGVEAIHLKDTDRIKVSSFYEDGASYFALKYFFYEKGGAIC